MTRRMISRLLRIFMSPVCWWCVRCSCVNGDLSTWVWDGRHGKLVKLHVKWTAIWQSSQCFITRTEVVIFGELDPRHLRQTPDTDLACSHQLYLEQTVVQKCCGLIITILCTVDWNHWVLDDTLLNATLMSSLTCKLSIQSR